MSLETGQILQDIGLCHDFTFLGAKIGSLATIPSPRTAGVCPPHARGGGPTPPEASPHARGGVPTPPEASPHARGGVGREQKGAPLPGSDVRLLQSDMQHGVPGKASKNLIARARRRLGGRTGGHARSRREREALNRRTRRAPPASPLFTHLLTQKHNPGPRRSMGSQGRRETFRAR